MTFAAAVRARFVRRAGLTVLASLACAIVATAAIEDVSFLKNLAQLVEDWEIAGVFAPRMAQDSDIVVVAIDDPTLEGFKYRSPVDRKFLNDLLLGIAAHHPRAIGLDILLDQPTEDDKDAALRHTIAAPPVPLVVSYIAASDTVSDQQLAFENAMVPAGERGLADLPTDQTDTVRSVFPGARIACAYVPGFARAIVADAGIRTAAVELPIVWHGHPPPTPVDPDPRPFLQVSALVAGVMPDSWFRGKIVLVGSDTALVDRHRTPFSVIEQGDAGRLPGVVIQANNVSQLVHARQPPQLPWPGDLIVAFMLALLGSRLGASNGSLWLRGAAVAALTLLFWAASLALYHSRGIMVGLAAPPLALAAGFVLQDSLSGRAARKQRKFIHGAMARYVSPKLLEQMVEDPARLSLSGERRLMTYLFTDIEDFTALSEKLDSTALTQLLNAYLDGITEIVLRHDGMVDKFIGDAVFAIFNAPLDLADHAQKAVECMLAIDDFAQGFRRDRAGAGFALGVTRIGVHTGHAVIGNFGSQARFTYTAQGDAVNVASRLESINKYFGTRVCVSDATRIACRGIAFRAIASVILKGKSEALELFEPLHEGALPPEFLSVYARAYDRLGAGAPEAEALFEALGREHPDDPCVRLHLRRIAEGAADAKIVMTEK